MKREEYMATYRLKNNELPMDDTWDVIIAGGGPSGCAAAIAAAREGARTLLVEGTGMLGGMGTAGLMPAWARISDRVRVIHRGIAEQVINASNAGRYKPYPDRIDWTKIDTEKLKRIYDEMVTASGATVLFNTTMTAVELSRPGCVDAILIANKAGLSALRAKVYVDCTGDGDLAAWAGAPFEKGDENGDMQPVTHCSVFSNVNEEAKDKAGTLHHSNPNSAGWDMAMDDEFPLIKDSGICDRVSGPGTVTFNALHQWGIDNTDPASTTHALITGRQMAHQFSMALRKYLPDIYGESFLVATAALLGVRETRRIIGDYVLNTDDYKSCRSFEDEIMRSCNHIDIHPSAAEMPEALRNRKEPTDRFDLEEGTSCGVPYRCLTPRGIENVLVAGRCISTDRTVHGSTRVMPECLNTGEAAGLAAAMAAGTNTADVHAVDTDALRRQLKAYGAYLPDA
jgi:hypothetical protein